MNIDKSTYYKHIHNCSTLINYIIGYICFIKSLENRNNNSNI